MAMDATSYTAKLAKLKEDQVNTVNRLRQNYEQEQKRIRENNQAKEAEREKNIRKQSDKDRREAELRVERMSDKAKSLLDARRNQFLRKNRELQEDFQDQRFTMASNYNRRLKNLADAYDRSLEQYKRESVHQARRRENQLLHLLDKERDYHGRDIKEIEAQAHDSTKAYQELMNDQKSEIVKDHQNKIVELQNKHNREKQLEKSVRNEKYDELKKIKNEEINHLTKRNQETRTRKVERDDTKLQNIADSYENQLNEVNRRNDYNYLQLQEQHKKELGKMQRQHDNENQTRKRETKLAMESSSNSLVAQKEKEQLAKGYERRIDTLKDALFQQNVKQNTDLNQASEDYKFSINNQRLAYKDAMDKNEDTHRDLMKNTREKYRQDRNTIIKNFREKIDGIEKMSQKNIQFEKTSGKVRLENQRAAFKDAYNQLNDDKIRLVTNIKDNNAREKVELLETLEKRKNDQLTNLREEYVNKIDRITNSYDKRIDQMTRNMQAMENRHEQGLKTIEQKLTREAKAEKMINEEARRADKKAMQNAYADLQRDNQLKFINLKKRFDQYVSKLKQDHDIMLTKMTQKHNDELQREKFEGQKILRRKLDDVMTRYSRLAKTSKQERESLISNYESKIDAIKRSAEAKYRKAELKSSREYQEDKQT